jgi:oligopeptide/dipeptide ABC transporter ATP-binding protein
LLLHFPTLSGPIPVPRLNYRPLSLDAERQKEALDSVAKAYSVIKQGKYYYDKDDFLAERKMSAKIVELASVDEIFDAPLHPYTQALIASAPQMQPGAERDAPLLQGDLPNPASPPSGCRFHTRCPYVTDECRQVEPISQVLDGGRQVACHRWQEINRDRSVIQIAPLSAAFLRRRALFEHAASHSSP